MMIRSTIRHVKYQSQIASLKTNPPLHLHLFKNHGRKFATCNLLIFSGSLAAWHYNVERNHSKCSDTETFRTNFTYLMFQLKRNINNLLVGLDTGIQVEEVQTDDQVSQIVLTDGHYVDHAMISTKVNRNPQDIDSLRHISSFIKEGTAFECTLKATIVPLNPRAPALTLSFGYAEGIDSNSSSRLWSFSGDCELIPSYFCKDDFVEFHSALLTAGRKHDPSFYPIFKRNADQSQYLSIGGIEFHDFIARPNLAPPDLDDRQAIEALIAEYVQKVIPLYISFLKRHEKENYGKFEKKWQARLVEGLVDGSYSRENIDKSWRPKNESREAEMLSILEKPREWAVDVAQLRELSFEELMAEVMKRTKQDLAKKS